MVTQEKFRERTEQLRQMFEEARSEFTEQDLQWNAYVRNAKMTIEKADEEFVHDLPNDDKRLDYGLELVEYAIQCIEVGLGIPMIVTSMRELVEYWSIPNTDTFIFPSISGIDAYIKDYEAGKRTETPKAMLLHLRQLESQLQAVRL